MGEHKVHAPLDNAFQEWLGGDRDAGEHGEKRDIDTRYILGSIAIECSMLAVSVCLFTPDGHSECFAQQSRLVVRRLSFVVCRSSSVGTPYSTLHGML